jgi:Kef-type K+ transport system membrane component KefB
MIKFMVMLLLLPLALYTLPKVVRRASESRINILKKASPGGYILIVCLFFSALASFLNVNVVFGAFLAGIAIGRLPGQTFAQEKIHLKEIALSFFVPVYFAIVGMRIDLTHNLNLAVLSGILIFSTLLVISSTLLVARLLKLNMSSGLNLGMAMNAKGGPGIVLATVAVDGGIISSGLFTILVLFSLLTSLSAGWWLKHVLSLGQNLIEPIARG